MISLMDHTGFERFEATCHDCHDIALFSYRHDPIARTRTTAEKWCMDHRCHPAGRGLAAAKAANWADEYYCDKQMGQYEDAS